MFQNNKSLHFLVKYRSDTGNTILYPSFFSVMISAGHCKALIAITIFDAPVVGINTVIRKAMLAALLLMKAAFHSGMNIINSLLNLLQRYITLH